MWLFTMQWQVSLPCPLVMINKVYTNYALSLSTGLKHYPHSVQIDIASLSSHSLALHLLIFFCPSSIHWWTGKHTSIDLVTGIYCCCRGIQSWVSNVEINPERLRRDLWSICVFVCVLCREGEDMAPLLSDPRVSLFTNGTIELSNVSHDDSGAYTCSITRHNTSITVHLEVFSEYHTLTLSPKPADCTGGSSFSFFF